MSIAKSQEIFKTIFYNMIIINLCCLKKGTAFNGSFNTE